MCRRPDPLLPLLIEGREGLLGTGVSVLQVLQGQQGLNGPSRAGTVNRSHIIKSTEQQKQRMHWMKLVIKKTYPPDP